MKIITASQSSVIAAMVAPALYTARADDSVSLRGHAKDLASNLITRKRKEDSSTSTTSVDPMRIFRILTSNQLIGGDLPEELEYQMPKNVEVCRDSFGQEDRTAEYLTGASSLPLLISSSSSPFGSFEYVQYSDDSYYGRAMEDIVDRADAVIEELYQAGLTDLMKKPSIMFDVDNTIQYTAFNDTDFVGEAPPISQTVEFMNKWCKGWGEGDRAIMNCILITARACTNMLAESTRTFVKANFDVDDDFISSHVHFSGNLHCADCRPTGIWNIAYKDIIRKDYVENRGVEWVASVGDQYTDSIGWYSGIKVKLPNVWFDSSKVSNQFDGTSGKKPALTPSGLIPEKDWATECSSVNHAPIAPGPQDILTGEALENARHYSSFDYCLAQKNVDQRYGCSVDVVTGIRDCGSLRLASNKLALVEEESGSTEWPLVPTSHFFTHGKGHEKKPQGDWYYPHHHGEMVVHMSRPPHAKCTLTGGSGPYNFGFGQLHKDEHYCKNTKCWVFPVCSPIHEHGKGNTGTCTWGHEQHQDCHVLIMQTPGHTYYHKTLQKELSKTDWVPYK